MRALLLVLTLHASEALTLGARKNDKDAAAVDAARASSTPPTAPPTSNAQPADAADADAAGDATLQPQHTDADATTPLAVWEPSASFVEEMRAHLARRRQRAEADLIGPAKVGLVRAAVGAVARFFRSDYLRNVSRSLLLVLLLWTWYVVNTKTYLPPVYEDD